MTDETKEVLDVVKDMFLDLKKDINRLDTRMDVLENTLGSVDTRVIKIESTLENEINKNIKLLAEGYQTMTEDVHQLKDDMEVVKFDVDIVKKVVTTHSTQINQLKKAK